MKHYLKVPELYFDIGIVQDNKIRDKKLLKTLDKNYTKLGDVVVHTLLEDINYKITLQAVEKQDNCIWWKIVRGEEVTPDSFAVDIGLELADPRLGGC